MRYFSLFLLAFGGFFGANSFKNGPLSPPDYTKWVNPFIGTDGTGHTFPGPCMPFGMVQPGPDNRDEGWDYTSGYQYQDTMIMGFSQTRANGTGISEFGDVLLQPFTGEKTDHFAESYLKSSETATPGYYKVVLKNKVKVELTATERVAFHRYTYPNRNANLLVDVQHGLRFLTDSLVLESAVQIENARTISGYCHTKNWVDKKYYFVLNFKQPFTSHIQLARKLKENSPRYILKFDLPDKILNIKVALSSVNVDGAKKNMEVELPSWDFKATVAHAKQVWNTYLSRIEIEADKKQKTIFYSCLYRLFIQPSNIADVDGLYRGPDDKIHLAVNGAYYSTLSLWDTHRAAHPLYTLIAPERVDGFVRSMVAHAQTAGFLPIWTAWGQDNYCMIGNHAIPVIADAYRKGFKGFNAEQALQEMVKSSTENHFNSNWTLLNQYGYYPFDSLDNEAVSRTLEHGVDDAALAQMAESMGKKEIAEQFRKRAAYFKNLYDPATRQMRGKDSKGHWRNPFNPLMATSPMNNPGDYTEANAWQYFWTPALHDVPGMLQLLGGKKGFTDQLDSFFTIKALNPNKHLGQEAMIGQYAHGNEPSHHIAYLYAFTDHPETGHALLHRICQEFYDDTPQGMIGNDDCGQMSAWYIFTTLGFYPVNPFDGAFVLGAAQVKNAVVHVGKGQTLRIEQKGVGQTTLDGNPVRQPSLTFEELTRGATILTY
ncbi:MAG: GH92 family glycosyl hydrolase [Saprospiraceae bacterium]|nr:GH92 family glycosyl hydrolase [Saprospiraceae bacterium]